MVWLLSLIIKVSVMCGRFVPGPKPHPSPRQTLREEAMVCLVLRWFIEEYLLPLLVVSCWGLEGLELGLGFIDTDRTVCEQRVVYTSVNCFVFTILSIIHGHLPILLFNRLYYYLIAVVWGHIGHLLMIVL